MNYEKRIINIFIFIEYSAPKQKPDNLSRIEGSTNSNRKNTLSILKIKICA